MAAAASGSGFNATVGGAHDGTHEIETGEIIEVEFGPHSGGTTDYVCQLVVPRRHPAFVVHPVDGLPPWRPWRGAPHRKRASGAQKRKARKRNAQNRLAAAASDVIERKVERQTS